MPLLVERIVPTKVIGVCNKDKPWFNGDYSPVFDLKQKDHLRWTRGHSRVNLDEFVHYQLKLVNSIPRLDVSLVSELWMF